MKKAVNIIVLITFIIYALVLFTLLFLDLRVSHGGFAEHLALSNFIPFRGISEYIIRAANNTINVGTAVFNIVGNLIAFFPMGCYLPCLFPKLRKVLPAIVILLSMPLLVECLQLFLCVGVFDIDDIVLNFGGGVAGYFLLKIPSIQSILKRIYVFS